MNNEQPKVGFFKKFPPQFWLVVMFEFFERGSYYGMMSFISVYFTDTLNIPKESVGVIKGVIQPLLYFLPILSGAIADRFGYRRVLMVAFALLGGGYFLTAQMTTYSAVFAALVIMGIGAGTFKPIISGTIAKITDESNSTQAFGIFYWSINLGAFLFPLFLVPALKAINPAYVIVASGICTAAMLIPTALFFKDPKKQEDIDKNTENRKKTSMIQTLANAFEIIYSPIVLLQQFMKRSVTGKAVISLLLVVFLGLSIWHYMGTPPASEKFPSIGIEESNTTMIFKVDRNMGARKAFKLEKKEGSPFINLKIHNPTNLDKYVADLLTELKEYPAFAGMTEERIAGLIKESDKKVELIFAFNPELADNFLTETSENQFKVFLKDTGNYEEFKENLLKKIHETPLFRGLTIKDCDKMVTKLTSRSFFWLFFFSLTILGLIVAAVSTNRKTETAAAEKSSFNPYFLLVLVLIGTVLLLPGLSMLGKIISVVIYFSIASLFIIDKSDTHKFIDHAKFLLMIVLYSGFWVLYFQMFDSVLWYVQAYVDAGSLNSAVNSFLGTFGIHIDWFFDVEHVTVINAGTIILLQLFISSIVKEKKAIPTLLGGLSIATVGMAMLAISTDIWIFMVGIVLFSIGEMTAHPKFISYIGLIAPTDKKAMYMGYLFLYGVFGSSIGGILGAQLYVHFVDNLNQPRTLWLIFSGIGVITIIALSLYNKFLAPKTVESK